MTFKKEYYDNNNLTKYRIVDVDNNRSVDEGYYLYQEWLKDGNTPEKISGDRFVSIVNNAVVIDPQKETILAQEDQLRKDMKLREEIAASDWKVLRHLEQMTLAPKDVNLKIKLTDLEFENLLRQRQSLRDQVSDKTGG